jgi:hypothetical protein
MGQRILRHWRRDVDKADAPFGRRLLAGFTHAIDERRQLGLDQGNLLLDPGEGAVQESALLFQCRLAGQQAIHFLGHHRLYILEPILDMGDDLLQPRADRFRLQADVSDRLRVLPGSILERGQAFLDRLKRSDPVKGFFGSNGIEPDKCRDCWIGAPRAGSVALAVSALLSRKRPSTDAARGPRLPTTLLRSTMTSSCR